MKAKEIILEASSPAQQAAIAINMKKRGKKPKHNESVMEADATDTVSMDIPLLLRMMEYAREDAKTDLDLHDVAEKMIALSKNHDYLCMDNYNEIVGSAAHDDMNEAVNDEYVMVDGKKVGAVWQDADGSWQSESAVSGMSWEGDDREDMVNHLIQIYNQAKREPSRSRRKEYMDNIASYNSMGEHVEESCPHCGGLMLPESRVDEKKDACYYKVKSRYKVWPSAYASGALVKCRKSGAKNWGNKSK
jgi:hypothetical protein